MKFSYIETFRKSRISERAVRRTVALIKQSVGGRFRVTCKERKTEWVIGFHGTADRTTIGNMMCGEFLVWSTAGNMRLRDLILGATVARMQQ